MIWSTSQVSQNSSAEPLFRKRHTNLISGTDTCFQNTMNEMQEYFWAYRNTRQVKSAACLILLWNTAQRGLNTEAPTSLDNKDEWFRSQRNAQLLLEFEMKRKRNLKIFWSTCLYYLRKEKVSEKQSYCKIWIVWPVCQNQPTKWNKMEQRIAVYYSLLWILVKNRHKRTQKKRTLIYNLLYNCGTPK